MMIRIFAAAVIPILFTGCAQQRPPRDYAALADWNYTIGPNRHRVTHVRAAQKIKTASFENAMAHDDPFATSSVIDRSSPLWTLERSAEQDPENQRLKRSLQICSGC